MVYWLAVKNSTDNPVSCVTSTCNGVKKSKDGTHETSVQRHLKQIYSEKIAIFYYILFIPSDHRFPFIITNNNARLILR